MATAKKIYYVADEQQEELAEATPLSQPQDQAAVLDEAAEAVCQACGELLAWHEEACQQAPVQPLGQAAAASAPRLGSTYAFDLGHRVQPAPATPTHTIIWRGQLRERHPATGLVHRVNVYRLDDGYWDCYREEELLVA